MFQDLIRGELPPSGIRKQHKQTEAIDCPTQIEESENAADEGVIKVFKRQRVAINLQHRIGPRITDQMSGQAYYEILLRFSDEELGEQEGKTLAPGIPGEVYLQSGYCSVLSYLVKPMVDQIEHALKER